MSDQTSGAKNPADEKIKKIAVGATVAGVLLIIFLVVVLIIQFVKWGVTAARERELDEQIETYKQMIDADEKDLQYYQTEQGAYYLALEHGYRK